MVLKIEEGKFYRSLGGERFGPMTPDDSFGEKAFISVAGDGNGWNAYGRYIGCSSINSGRKFDLVSEWRDDPSPVRTVTRKEVVPGHFGLVEIEGGPSRVTEDGVSLWLPRNHRYSPAELRATAATLVELADALEPSQ